MKKLYIALMGVLMSTMVWAEDAAPVSFPDLDATYLKTGDFVNIADLQKVAFEQHKDQVRLLIGNPHFSEGIAGVRVWNYAFNFYTNNEHTSYVTCQYQVQYDKDYRVNGMYWRDPECAKYLNQKQIVIQTHPITISSDGLFTFARSGLNDLQPPGRANLKNLADQIKDGYSNLRSIDIMGHTDRIGSASSNMALSIARANTVKQYFISRGIDGSKIRTQGMGSMQPVAFCDGPVSPKIIACLMPNRRIEISVTGDK